MPPVSRQFNAVAAPPASAAAQESLTRIDPVAIGKSLGSTQPLTESRPLSARPLSTSDFQFADGLAPPTVAPAVPAPAPRLPITAGSKAAAQAAEAPCFGAPPLVVPAQKSIEADFASPAARSEPKQSLETIQAPGGRVTTADFKIAEPTMPARVTDVDPLHALAPPGTGFPPLSAKPTTTTQRAVTTVSDGPESSFGAVQPAGYNRPNDAAKLPPSNQNWTASNQNWATGRSGETFSSDAAPVGSTSVSDSSPSPATPSKTPLHWGP